MSAYTWVAQQLAKSSGSAKNAAKALWSGGRKSGSDIVPSASTEIALYDPKVAADAVRKMRLKNLGRGAVNLSKYGVGGYGALQLGKNLLGGGTSTTDVTNQLPADYTPWSPQQALEDQYAQAVAIISGTAPNPQVTFDRLAEFNRMAGALGGVGGGGAAGSNVYAQQAQKILDEAAAGSGSATSSLSPVAGTVRAATDNMIAQGGTLDDYIKMMESNAARAGIKMTADMKAKLYTDAMNNMNARNNAIQQQLQELALQRVAGLQAASQYPEFIVDDTVLKSAEALRRAGGNKAPLNYYIDRLAKEYYRGLASQG